MEIEPGDWWENIGFSQIGLIKNYELFEGPFEQSSRKYQSFCCVFFLLPSHVYPKWTEFLIYTVNTFGNHHLNRQFKPTF